MEFEQMVDALEIKLQPKVFVEYSSTLRACLGLFGIVWARLGSFGFEFEFGFKFLTWYFISNFIGPF